MIDLALTDRLAVPPDVLFRNLDGEGVLVNLATGVYYGLDAIGTRLWELLSGGCSLEESLRSLLERFEVDRARAETDVRALVSELCERGLLRVLS
jgi:hypothetical protein